ncbi:restriction endonuclease subunit S [Shewanella baltica]|uniref:restriction endonuclease subunit S n=1 Tax=Shewanella baltica TaxID=62322 RepID=UPI003D79D8D0
MSSLVPDGWNYSDFGNVAQSIKSGLSRRISAQDIGIPVLISGNIQSNRLDTSELKFWYLDDPQGADIKRYLLNDNDLLLCFINSVSQIGKVCIYKDIGRPAIYTTNLFRIAINSKNDTSFVYNLMINNIFQEEIQLITKPAVNQASFTKTDLELIKVLLPPLSEQQKIAAILTSVDEVIEKTQAQIDKLKDLKSAMMQELLTKGVGIKQGDKYEPHTEFKDSPVGKIPKSWEVAPIVTVLERVIDYRGKSPPKSDTGIPLLTAKNIRKGYINEEPREYIPVNKYDDWMTRGIPSYGDVFITTEAPLGNVAKVPKYRFAIGQRVLALCPKRAVIDTDYLLFVMQGEYFAKQLELQSTGSTVAGIKQSTFKNILLAIPSLEEQQIIAKCIESNVAKTTTLAKKLISLKNTKKALMQDLLTGKVRVKVDNDSVV